MRRILSVGVIAALLAGSAALAQDQATVVAPLESRRPMASAPKVGEGAPYYSVEQLQVEGRQATRNASCIANASRRLTTGGFVGPYRSLRINNQTFKLQSEETRIASLARRARLATLAAEDARVRLVEGKADQAEVERTELERQAAVRAYDKLLNRDFGLGYDPVIDPKPPVEITVVSASIREENGKEVMVVSGEIRNILPGRSTLIPVITLAIYDLDGNLMTATAALPTTGRLAAGESRPFALRTPHWKDAARVRVTPGQHAAFLGDRDFCKPRSGGSVLAAAREYRMLQDNLRFNRPPPAKR